MPTIQCTTEQLATIRYALEFYSRIGMLQLEEILNHPSVEEMISENHRPKKELDVGDNTIYGTIVDISKKYVWVKDQYGENKKTVKYDRAKIKLSPNYTKYHETKDLIRRDMNLIKNCISNGEIAGGSYGIYSKRVDNSCREAFDMVQIIRHEFWKQRENKSNYTVDASVYYTTDTKNFEVKLD